MDDLSENERPPARSANTATGITWAVAGLLASAAEFLDGVARLLEVFL
jgi:hypothetical protein